MKIYLKLQVQKIIRSKLEDLILKKHIRYGIGDVNTRELMIKATAKDAGEL